MISNKAEAAVVTGYSAGGFGAAILADGIFAGRLGQADGSAGDSCLVNGETSCYNRVEIVFVRHP